MYAPRFRAAQAAVLATAATLSLIAAAAPAQAQPVSVPVSYHDLDLASESGQHVLAQRVRRAATAACGINQVYDLAEKSKAAACRRAALAGAQHEIAIAVAQQAAPRLASRSTAN